MVVLFRLGVAAIAVVVAATTAVTAVAAAAAAVAAVAAVSTAEPQQQQQHRCPLIIQKTTTRYVSSSLTLALTLSQQVFQLFFSQKRGRSSKEGLQSLRDGAHPLSPLPLPIPQRSLTLATQPPVPRKRERKIMAQEIIRRDNRQRRALNNTTQPKGACFIRECYT